MSNPDSSAERKRARDEQQAQQAGEVQQPLITPPAVASDSTSDDERAAKQPKLNCGGAAASHSAPSMTLAISHISASSLSPETLAAASSSTPSPVQPSSMLRCLTLCRDAQFSLMQMLELKDLAPLDATCRSWRAWLLHPPLIDGLGYTVAGRWSKLKPMINSRWARQLVVTLKQEMYEHEDEYHARFSAGDAAEQMGECGTMLQTLPLCVRLCKLKLQFKEAPQASLDTCFSRVAGSLTSLCMRIPDFDNGFGIGFSRALRPLINLVKLHVATDETDLLDFAALPLMPRLSTFSLRRGKYLNDHFRCTPVQVLCLAECRTLTELNCGSWSPVMDDSDADGWPLSTPEQQVAKGIGALVSGWLDWPSSSSASAASVSLASVTGARAPIIRRLYLSSTEMSAAVWAHVSRLTSLTELTPVGWLDEITPVAWAKLADFSQMHHVLIDRRFQEALSVEMILPALLRCTQLRSLCFGLKRLSFEQLHAICTGLPNLTALRIWCTQLEDCSPLSLAPALHSLELIECSGLDDESVQFRTALPSLPLLTTLTIFDKRDQRLSEQQAAPLNAALLARLPKLTPEHFEQNLLDAAEHNDSGEDQSDDEESSDDECQSE